MGSDDLLGGQVEPHLAATLVALMRVHARDGRATFRSVAAELGSSPSTAHHNLKVLRRMGLAAWVDNVAGTLRPLVMMVGAL